MDKARHNGPPLGSAVATGGAQHSAADRVPQAEELFDETAQEGRRAASETQRSGVSDHGRTARGEAPKRADAPSADGKASNPRKDAPSVRGEAPNAKQRATSTDQPNQPPARKRLNRSRRPNYAALDLGTNNCRLLIARPDRDGFQVIDAFSRVVWLGEGLAESGVLSQAAIERSVAALRMCADRLQRHRVARYRAIATEACRRASNERAFLSRVRGATGISLDVIAAEEEARLAVAGCAPLFDPSLEQLLVFDIGGGSTELIWVDLSKVVPARRRSLLMALAHGASRSDRARAAAQHVADWISLPAGVVTLGEQYDYIVDDRARFEAMGAHVQELMKPFAEKFRITSPEMLAKLQVLGTSGTITTLAGVHLDLERYSRRAVDGLWVSSTAVDRVIQRLLEMNDYERAAIPCVGEDRATHLMSGAAILRTILRTWSTRRLRVADRGLREGMLYGLMQEGVDRRQRR